MLIFEKGNIVTGKYPIFCQQVNCQHKMGSGLARQIRLKYPEVYKSYMGIKDQKLGFIDPVDTKDGKVCISMFAQEYYGNDGKRYTDYNAFRQCLNAIAGFVTDIDVDIPIAFPYMIGCGLGGGDWYIILGMIKDFANKIPNKVVIVMLEDKNAGKIY